jgi:hypothetical protein
MKLKTSIIALILFSTFLIGNSNAQTNSSKNNVPDSLRRQMQISFLPYMGTDGAFSGKGSYNVSLNILAGTVNEVSGLEMGGLMNHVHRNVGKCQLAGVGNIVGGKVTGFQAAGIFNQTNSAQGVQAAGVINNTETFSGIQIAGTANNARKASGTQISGVANNASKGKCIQISGVVNNSDSSDVQMAGIVNNANVVSGTQIAGIVNRATEISGAQISGVINIAKKIKGVQIGFINIADSCDGTAIGVINIIKNGVHQLEIYGDELFYSNIAFRSGTTKFHTILTAGIRPQEFDNPLWTYGSGIGTTFAFTKKTALDLDGSFSHVIRNGDFGNNFLYKATLSLDHKLCRSTSIIIGFTYNFLSTNTRSANYTDAYSSIAHYSFTNHTYSNGYNLKSWAGVKVGLRFF